MMEGDDWPMTALWTPPLDPTLARFPRLTWFPHLHLAKWKWSSTPAHMKNHPDDQQEVVMGWVILQASNSSIPCPTSAINGYTVNRKLLNSLHICLAKLPISLMLSASSIMVVTFFNHLLCEQGSMAVFLSSRHKSV